MAETIVLDPSDVATNRTQIDITPWIAGDGVDWGDAAITAYMAEASRGQLPVDYRVPNRTITIPLRLLARGTATFAHSRSWLQSKASLIQREGGYLKRVTSAGGTVYCDLVNATLHLGGGWGQAVKDYDIDATLTLEAVPDFYGAEIDLGDNSTTTLPELVYTDTAIQGDYPGRVRIVVDEDDAEYQLGLIWGFRARHYSSAATARLSYEAEQLERLSGAALQASASIPTSGGTSVYLGSGTVGTNWTPITGMNLGGTAYLTHTGSYRVWGRVVSDGGTAVQTRLVWDVGDFTSPVENAPFSLHQTDQWEMCDLGEIRLDPAPSGTHRWAGQIQCRGTAATEVVAVDKVFFQPLDEGAGKLTAPRVGSTFTSYSARDNFINHSAGALTGKTAPVGGVWTVVTNSDTDDFAVGTATPVTRATASDSGSGGIGIGAGRGVTVGTTNYTDIAAQIDAKTSSAASTGTISGLMFRTTDNNDYVSAQVVWAGWGTGKALVRLISVSASSTDVVVDTAAIPFAADSYYTLKALIYADGIYQVWFQQQGAADTLRLSGRDDVLATGGTRATGRVGFADSNSGVATPTRTYKNFAAWVPVRDAVMFPSQSLELRTEGMFREDSGGTAWGPVPVVTGDLPRIPVSGLEGRTVETFLKASRGDFDTIPDAGVDDISARPFYRPSWLYVPGT